MAPQTRKLRIVSLIIAAAMLGSVCAIADVCRDAKFCVSTIKSADILRPLAAGEKENKETLARKRAIERFVGILSDKLPPLHDKIIAFLGQERFKTRPPSGRTQVEWVPREIRDEFQDLLLSALGTPEASGIAEFTGMRQLILGHTTGDPNQTKGAFLDMLCANGYFLSLRKIKVNQNGWVFPDLPSWSIDEIVDMGVNNDEVAGRPVPATVISIGRPLVTGLLKEQDAAVGITEISVGGHPLIVMSDTRIRQRLDDIFELRKWIYLKGKEPLPDDVVKRYILLDHTLDLTRFALLRKEWSNDVFSGYMDSGGKERFINEHFPSSKYLMLKHEKIHLLADSYGANPEQSEILACLYDVGGPEWQGYSYRWLRLFLLVEKVKGGVSHEALHGRAAQYILFEALPQIAFSTTDVDAIAMLKAAPNLPNRVLLGCLPIFERLLSMTVQKAMATGCISNKAASQLEASVLRPLAAGERQGTGNSPAAPRLAREVNEDWPYKNYCVVADPLFSLLTDDKDANAIAVPDPSHREYRAAVRLLLDRAVGKTLKLPGVEQLLEIVKSGNVGLIRASSVNHSSEIVGDGNSRPANMLGNTVEEEVLHTLWHESLHIRLMHLSARERRKIFRAFNASKDGDAKKIAKIIEEEHGYRVGTEQNANEAISNWLTMYKDLKSLRGLIEKVFALQYNVEDLVFDICVEAQPKIETVRRVIAEAAALAYCEKETPYSAFIPKAQNDWPSAIRLFEIFVEEILSQAESSI